MIIILIMNKIIYILIPYILYYFPKNTKYFKTYSSNLQNIAKKSDLLDAIFSKKPELLKKYINKNNSKENLDNLLQIHKKLKYYFSLQSKL